MRLFTRLLIVSAFFQLQGCAYNAQQAKLDPTIPIIKSDQGRNASVLLQIADERATKSLGKRADTFGPAAEISASQELDDVIRTEVTKILENKGFKVIRDGEGGRTILKIEIRHFEYTMSQGWTFGLHVTGAIKAVALRDGKPYEKLYRSSIEERVFVVPTAKTNEEVINRGLSALLSEMVKDEDLFKSLANP
jgi:uncharacterized lipoprotein YajG